MKIKHEVTSLEFKSKPSTCIKPLNLSMLPKNMFIQSMKRCICCKRNAHNVLYNPKYQYKLASTNGFIKTPSNQQYPILPSYHYKSK